MKYLCIIAWSFLAITANGQDHLLNKSGSSYCYKGQEYNCKDLGMVYSGYDLPLYLYNGGRTDLKSSKTCTISGAILFGVGYGTSALSSDN